MKRLIITLGDFDLASAGPEARPERAGQPAIRIDVSILADILN